MSPSVMRRGLHLFVGAFSPLVDVDLHRCFHPLQGGVSNGLKIFSTLDKKFSNIPFNPAHSLTSHVTSTPLQDPPKKLSGLHKPCKVLGPLAAFLGTEESSRVSINRQIWAYIKQHDLQDPENKRFILPDSKLMQVLNMPRISMFDMQKVLNKFIKS